LDAAGKLVRRYSSTDCAGNHRGRFEGAEHSGVLGAPARVLPADGGLHRWVWDLHGAPPESLRHEYPIAAVPHDTPRLPQGPRALPGVYTVKLTADGRQLHRAAHREDGPAREDHAGGLAAAVRSREAACQDR
jgi:hypothetical protein